MLKMEDNVYKNKYSVKAALGIIKACKKLDKIRQAESDKFGPEYQIYIQSEEYTKLQEELKKKEEDDDYRNDPDPQGFDLYKKIVIFHKWLINL